MKLIQFPEQTVVIAKDQPEYEPMPAHIHTPGDQAGRITCCWELTDAEIAELLRTKCIWQTVMTFGQPLQPQLLTVEKPDMPRRE